MNMRTLELMRFFQNQGGAVRDLLKIAVNMPARTFKAFIEPERPYYINPEEE